MSIDSLTDPGTHLNTAAYSRDVGGLIRVKGSKTLTEYMFSESLRIADKSGAQYSQDRVRMLFGS